MWLGLAVVKNHASKPLGRCPALHHTTPWSQASTDMVSSPNTHAHSNLLPDLQRSNNNIRVVTMASQQNSSPDGDLSFNSSKWATIKASMDEINTCMETLQSFNSRTVIQRDELQGWLHTMQGLTKCALLNHDLLCDFEADVQDQLNRLNQQLREINKKKKSLKEQRTTLDRDIAEFNRQKEELGRQKEELARDREGFSAQ